MTKEQRDQYERDGFFVVKGTNTKEEIAEWNQRFIDICRKNVKRPFGVQIMHDISQVKKGLKADNEQSIAKL